MVVLIIIAVIIFLILLTLNIHAEAYIRFYGGKLDIKVKYLFLNIYPRKKKPPKKAKKGHKKYKEYPPLPADDTADKEQNDTPETADEVTAAADTEPASADNDIPIAEKKERPPKPKAEKPPLMDRINDKLDELAEKKNSISLLMELIGEPLKRFGGKLRIDDVIIDCAAADEDAAKAAVFYGTIGSAVYNTISFLRQFIAMSVKSVNISCLYNTPSDKSRFDGECKLHLRPASLVNAIFAVLFGYMKDKKKYSPVMELLGKDK